MRFYTKIALAAVLFAMANTAPTPIPNDALAVRSYSNDKRDAALNAIKPESEKRDAALNAIKPESEKRDAALNAIKPESEKRDAALNAIKPESEKRSYWDWVMQWRYLILDRFHQALGLGEGGRKYRELFIRSLSYVW